MSIIASLLRVAPGELEEILNDSSKIGQKLEHIYEQEEIDREVIRDLDKSWEGLLFVLTGQTLAESDSPLSRVLFSGQIVDEEQDLGYGPGHYLTPEQVRELNDMLMAINADDLQKRYDSKAMAGIYPEIWDDNSGLEYVLHYFNVLKEIYAGAAQNNEAVITFLS